MPRLIDPRGHYPIVMQSDLDKPVTQQPTFLARVLSDTAYMQFHAEYDAALAPGKKIEASIAERYAVAAKHLVGWKHMVTPSGETIAYEAATAEETLKRIIDPIELFELLNQISAGGRLTFEDRKNSASPPCSSTDSCAATANPDATDTPDASTAPANSSPPRLGVRIATKEDAPPAETAGT